MIDEEADLLDYAINSQWQTRLTNLGFWRSSGINGGFPVESSSYLLAENDWIVSVSTLWPYGEIQICITYDRAGARMLFPTTATRIYACAALIADFVKTNQPTRLKLCDLSTALHDAYP